MDDQAARHAAGGMCECAGQCGATHSWTADAPKRRCRAPHGCTIVRRKEYASFWQLAASDTLPLEHAEHYAVDNPILVELRAVLVPDGKQGKVIAACQRCKLLIEEAMGTGKKRRGKPLQSTDG